MKKAYLGLMVTMMALLFAQKATAKSDCSKIKFKAIKSADNLAEVMGKNKIYDLKMMQAFGDDEVFKKGQVIFFKRPKLAPRILIGRKLRNSNKWLYDYSQGKQLIINFDTPKRNIASRIIKRKGNIICLKK